MPKDKKHKKKKVDELRMTLDNIEVEKLDKDEKKFIESLEKRIKDDHKKHMIYRRKTFKKVEDVDPFKPKIKIYENPNKKSLLIPEKKVKEFEEIKTTEDVVEEEIDSTDSEVVEEITGPEFIEVKPKEVEKEPEFEEVEKPVEDLIDKEEIKTKKIVADWEPVEVIDEKKTEDLGVNEEELEEKIEDELKEEVEDLKKCPNCGIFIESGFVFCPECGLGVNGVTTKMEKPADESTWEPVSVDENLEDEIEKAEDEDLDKEKIDVFKDFESIDDKSAILLFDSGIITLDILKEKKVKDLSKIKGINKKTAKDIKKEIDNLEKESLEVKPEPISVESSEEESKDQKDIDENISDGEPVESFEVVPGSIEVESDIIEGEIEKEVEVEDIKEPEIEDEWLEVEEIEELDLEEKPDLDEDDFSEDYKLEVFKDFSSIDDDIARVLYDNGFVNMDTLVIASVRDFTKIGIKKRTAKNIKKEVKQKLEESTKKMEEERIVKDGFTEYVVNDDFEELEGELIEEKIKEEEIKKSEEDDVKNDSVDVFRDIDSIDEGISKILYENGITSIKVLKETTIGELTKIRGIRRKLAKKIKNEVKYLADEDFGEIDTAKDMVKDSDSEWENVEVEDSSVEEKKGYKHGDYFLYEKKTTIKGGNTRTIRFFSKETPDEGVAIDLPEGYDVRKNKKTGVPYLRKTKK